MKNFKQMKKNSKNVIISTVIVIVFVINLTTAFSVNSRFLADDPALPYKCVDSDRNKDCKDSIARKVCGWFNENIKCIRYPCAVSADSVCLACANTDVAEVTDKSCENQDDKPVTTTDNTLPDDQDNTDNTDDAIFECKDPRDNELMCTQDWLPVCGYKQKSACKETDKACVQEFGNNCTACKDPQVMYTRKGECPVFKGDTDADTDNNTDTKDDNNTNVKYTIDGKVDDSNLELHFCTSDEQSVKDCDGVKDDNTCGFKNCDGDKCSEDFVNHCLACKGEGIIYTTAGKCAEISSEGVRLKYLSMTTRGAEVSTNSTNVDTNSSSVLSVLGFGFTVALLFISF
jgi:hypothetical protein